MAEAENLRSSGAHTTIKSIKKEKTETRTRFEQPQQKKRDCGQRGNK